jgi:Rod binding domain-containing protein
MTKVSPVPAVQAAVAPTLAAQSSAAQSLAALGPTAQGMARTIRPSPTADPAKLAKSAQDFEAMAIGQLLQPMFDTVDTSHDAFGGGAGEEAWKPMLVQEFAKQIAAHGGLGLAKPVYEAMLRMQETDPK